MGCGMSALGYLQFTLQIADNQYYQKKLHPANTSKTKAVQQAHHERLNLKLCHLKLVAAPCSEAVKVD